jgi:hypothetical protein
MTLADSRETSDEDLTKHRAQAAAELYMPRSNEQHSGSGSDRVSTARRLDVDAVLERSLRRVVNE